MNAESAREANRRHYWKDIERSRRINREKARRYRDADRDAWRAKGRAYYANNREKLNAKNRLQYQKHREKRLAYCRGVLLRNYARKIAKEYGLTEVDVILKLKAGCEACGAVRSGSRKGTRVGADHNHLTGEFRGMLCNKCNAALGLLGDDARRLAALLCYLWKPREMKAIP